MSDVMSDEGRRNASAEAWFKELENRLDRIAAQLEDAGIKAGHSMELSARIHRELSVVQDLVARLEDRVAMVNAEVAGEPPPAPIDAASVEYRDVPGFPGYRASSDGRIWGSRRAGRGYGLTREWRALKPYLLRPGPALTVSLYRERERHPLRVDAVVLLAFVGPCPDGCGADHVNGDPLDNRLENLRYMPSPPRDREG